MLARTLNTALAETGWWPKTVNYEILPGNPIWRLAIVLLVLLLTLAAGRVVQFALNSIALRRERKADVTVLTLFLKCLSKPAYVAFFALGLYISILCVVSAYVGCRQHCVSPEAARRSGR